MDVAKYIGLLLLKNDQCYVDGLGALLLIRKPATYTGQALQPATYDVKIAQGEEADDLLVNFIAKNERTSTAKAADAIYNYSTHVKAQLQKGEQIPFVHIGSFKDVNGYIGFITSSEFLYQPEPITTEKVAVTPPQQSEPKPESEPQPQQEAEEYPESSGRTNWGTVFIVLLIVAVLGVGGYYAYTQYYAGDSSTTIEEPVDEEPVEEYANEEAITDTTNNSTDTTTTAPVENNTTVAEEPVDAPTPGVTRLKALVNIYDDRARAEKRQRQFRAYGVEVDLIVIDSNTFHIVMPVESTTKNKQEVLDSLTNMYNPSGVKEYNR